MPTHLQNLEIWYDIHSLYNSCFSIKILRLKKTQSRDAMFSYYMIVEPFGLNKEHKNVITAFGALTKEYFGRELLALWQNIEDNDNKGRKSPGPSVSETLVTVPRSCLSGLLVSEYTRP